LAQSTKHILQRHSKLKTTERNHHSLTYKVLKPVIAFIYLTENMWYNYTRSSKLPTGTI